jgi:hypothetical protein
MNTEQLRAEFAEMSEVSGLPSDLKALLVGILIRTHELGFQAAAQSRDELIGKLVEALDLAWLNEHRRGMMLKASAGEYIKLAAKINADNEKIKLARLMAKKYGATK